MTEGTLLRRFAKRLTQYDPLLQERVEGLYHKIFEGIGTNAALDALRDKVGDNNMETEGDGVFGLSQAAGFDDSATPAEALDSAIQDGVEAGNLDDFGTAIPEETLPPTEDDFGLGDMGPEDAGMDDLFGEDTGDSGDLGLDGLDDELEETDGDDDLKEPEGEAGEKPGDSGDDMGDLGL